MRAKTKVKETSFLYALGLGFMGLAAFKFFRKREDLRGKVIFITGGSTGLGLVLAKELSRQGARVAICARDGKELQKALAKIREINPEAIALKCDVSQTEEVKDCIDKVLTSFGRIDILINNAGIIQVGPMESFGHKEYEKAMDVMYWGIANTTFAVMDPMKAQGGGQIVNITSIGGKLALPHLLPYTASKFAAVGFSEGVTEELAKDGIYVTTIVPGLMRTGSYVNAKFNKDDTREFSLFSALSNTPLLTISADRAAGMIIRAIKKRKVYKVLGFQARIMIGAHNTFPNLLPKLMGLVGKALPKSKGQACLDSGRHIESASSSKNGFKNLRESAKKRYQDLEA